MRKFIFLLVTIVFLGCKDDSKKLESLEIMSYYFVPNEKAKKMEIDFLIYSIVDLKGNAKVLRKNEPMSKEYSSYEAKISQHLFDKISQENLNKNEEFYNNPNRKTDPDIYCGPIKRVRLKYKNGYQFSFIFTSEEDKKINDFVLLLKNLEKSSKQNVDDLDSFKKEQKKFQELAMKKDTTMLSLPPFPKLKIDEVKFIKHQ